MSYVSLHSTHATVTDSLQASMIWSGPPQLRQIPWLGSAFID